MCVIEIKDEYKQSERPTEAIKQAIAYATFLIHLIRKANTEEYHWYKDIFGVNNQMENSIVVDAVIAMPYKTGIDNWDAMPEQDKKLCEIPRLKVGKDFIQLHSIFFEKEIYTEAQGFAVKGLEASFNKNH